MPLYCSETIGNGGRLAIWKLAETEEALTAQCSLSGYDVEKISFVTNPQRRKERLAVYLLLHHLFGKNVQLDYHANGQPLLQNQFGHISVSHTRRFVAIIYHPETPVGIDIEDTTRKMEAVEKKALSDNERNYLSDKNRAMQLCLIWCAKEALFKWAAESEIDFARQIEVAEFTPHSNGQLAVQFTDKANKYTTLHLPYRIVEDHAMVWVVA